MHVIHETQSEELFLRTQDAEWLQKGSEDRDDIDAKEIQYSSIDKIDVRLHPNQKFGHLLIRYKTPEGEEKTYPTTSQENPMEVVRQLEDYLS